MANNPPPLSSTTTTSGIVPAQLGFLAIYNPGLGATDETVDDQIVYYAASPAALPSQSKRKKKQQQQRRHRRQDQNLQHHHHGRRRGSGDGDGDGDEAGTGAGRIEEEEGGGGGGSSSEERNERLRQIGLAQAMVEFGRSFSGGRAVDSVDTEKSRVVLRELEPGWWILASVDLTRLPLSPAKVGAAARGGSGGGGGATTSGNCTAAGSLSDQGPVEEQFEYSAREVKPAVLLLQDLLRAHAVFLLHHAPSLSALYARAGRAGFAALLGRYWDLFVSTWNVLLHGNPACSVLGGIKIAASGELGVGVGEEDRGSGERDVLEGLVGRVEGLVDLVVGRFGEQAVSGGKEQEVAGVPREEWLGMGNEPGAEDGAVFLGAGALSRQSLRALVYWMEDVYTWGENAYGVFGSPGTRRSQHKRRKAGGSKAGTARLTSASKARQDQGKGKSNTTSLPPEDDVGSRERAGGGGAAAGGSPAAATAKGESGMDKIFSYLKLGYGSSWSLGASNPSAQSDTDSGSAAKPRAPESAGSSKPPEHLNTGRFLIGLTEEIDKPEQSGSPGREPVAKPNTVTVELAISSGSDSATPEHPGSEDEGRDRKAKTADLRPVIYINRPFIYIFLFRPECTYNWPAFSQLLQTQLAPLHKSLLTSTVYRPEKPTIGPAPSPSTQIYDLVFDPDPSSLTIHSTIPNIPDPILPAASDSAAGAAIEQQQHPQRQKTQQAWTRVEALSTHTQILNLFVSTRQRADDSDSNDDNKGGGAGAQLERTCKTSRGWWVIWSRQAPEQQQQQQQSYSAGTSTSLGDIDEEEGGEEEEEGGGSTTARPGGSVGAGDTATAAATTAAAAAAAGKEIFLIRRASDHAGGGRSAVSSSYVGVGVGSLGAGGGWVADGASRLAQGMGIGVDTRRYIEGLLSLNR